MTRGVFQPSLSPKPSPPSTEGKHLIEDIKYSRPMYVVCTCGFRFDAESVYDLTQGWREHTGRKPPRRKAV